MKTMKKNYVSPKSRTLAINVASVMQICSGETYGDSSDDGCGANPPVMGNDVKGFTQFN